MIHPEKAGLHKDRAQAVLRLFSLDQNDLDRIHFARGNTALAACFGSTGLFLLGFVAFVVSQAIPRRMHAKPHGPSRGHAL
jgi:hypothetical protein